jgi:type IV secretion system protein VirD4
MTTAHRSATDDWLLPALLGAAAAAVATVWAGAALALAVAGHPGRSAGSLEATVQAIVRLARDPAHPASAWPPGAARLLPGPAAYWLSTAVAATLSLLLAAVGHRLWPRANVGSVRRRPLGIDAIPRFARRRELRDLHHRGEGDRFVLGVIGRTWLATPNGRKGSPPGAIALVGPSRSGKTTAAITGILRWHGPAVLSSVKGDLLDATIATRRDLGDVRLYDPTGSTGRRGDGAWSPVRLASTAVAAQRAARTLCDAAPQTGVDGGADFWLAQAEILLSGLLYVAHHTGRDMGAVADWVMTQDRPGERGSGEVHTALVHLQANPHTKAELEAARRAIHAIWALEDKTLSSVYATAQTVIWPWADPGVARAAERPNITLEWLTAGANTAYLCAPIEDQKRLAPAFGGLLNDLIKAVYLRVTRTGKPLDPPLLIVIDEAGNIPLRSLPEYASTLAGLGVVLVTVWQSLAQLEAAHGRQADTVLTNHRTKIFFSGLSDPSSLRYLTQVLGETEVETTSRSNRESGAPSSTQRGISRVNLVPAHAVRQMRPGDGLLLHGSLPPAHVRTVPYFSLRALNRGRRLGRRASTEATSRDWKQRGPRTPHRHRR